ncbi:MAG: PHP domain-containing protein [Ignavibacteriaceae bacterium]|nr:PHP domain-containing protein [Ignavibacteriaceae bacterium]
MIPLRIHTHHSLLRSAVAIKSLVEKAAEYKFSALAITDYNSMAGFVQLAKACKENNIKPIYGVYLDDPQKPEQYICLLAKNREGYNDICRLITSRKLQTDFSLGASIRGLSSNLFAFSASPEIVESQKNNPCFFVELIDSVYYKKQNKILFDYCEKHQLRYIVSPSVYFLRKDDFTLYQVLNAMRIKGTVENLETEYQHDDLWLKNPSDVEKRWQKITGASENTELIAEQCSVDIELGKYKFPEFQIPDGEDAYSKLFGICSAGLSKRKTIDRQKANERLLYELSVIKDLKFLDYFLVVWDIIESAKKRGMYFIGRGSAANSIVSYAMGLTGVDPLEHDLYFERFLNRGRLSPPDIDIDFSWKERDEIIKYVFKKYGYEKTAMICTTVTFRGRSAFREVAKVYGFSDREISKFSKFIPWTSAANLPEIHNMYPESRNLPFDKEPWKSIVQLASQLGGYPRHLSIHPGGIVIAPDRITNHVALDYAQNKGLGLVVTQTDMYSIEDLGLVKIDLLSQRSLGVLKTTLTMLNDE